MVFTENCHLTQNVVHHDHDMNLNRFSYYFIFIVDKRPIDPSKLNQIYLQTWRVVSPLITEQQV